MGHIFGVEKNICFHCRILSCLSSDFEFTGSTLSKHIEIVDEAEATVATSMSCLDQVKGVRSNRPFDIIWYKGADSSQNVSDIKDSRSWVFNSHNKASRTFLEII